MEAAIMKYRECSTNQDKANYALNDIIIKKHNFMKTKRGANRVNDPAYVKRLAHFDRMEDSAKREFNRAEKLCDIAAHIARRRILERVIPITENVLCKYIGKSATGKYSQRPRDEIAEEIGFGAIVEFVPKVYGEKFDHVVVRFPGIAYELTVEFYTKSRKAFVDDKNRFIKSTFETVDNSDLPDDLEAWVDEYERAETALEEAKKAF